MYRIAPAVGKDLAWLDERKARLLALLDDSEGELPTSAGGWTLLDVATHLMRVEEYAVAQSRANRASTRRRSWRDRWHYLMVRLVLASPLRGRVPVPDVDPKLHPIPLPELTRTWDEVRRSIHEAIEGQAPEKRQIAYLYHPFARHLTLENGVTFLVLHWRSHERQIRALTPTGAAT